ncbi:MAG TPA: META domain-containing protein [Beijerinckiaceae bacterium]|jgi:heat shock protein HslJ|nr:META domain-containing protein [Beijerinckiaceae bacterium]
MKAFRIAVLFLAAAASTPADAQRRPGSQSSDPQKQPPKNEGLAPRQEKTFPTKVAWMAVSLNGKPFSGERPTFILDEQFRLRGFGGCNTFSATAYPLREQRFAVGPFALTKKACDKALMDQEKNFLIALRTSVQWDTVAGDLVIKSQNGELKFQRSI